MPALSEGTGIVLAGVFGALIAVFGWLLQSSVSWLVWLYQRKAAEYERLIALRAEIASNIEFEAKYSDPQVVAGIVEKMRERAATNEPVHPYTVIFRENIVFDRIKPDITSLPKGVIGEVVDYYLKSGGLDATLADQRTKFYGRLPLERAIGVWNSIQALATEAVLAGKAAVEAINRRIRQFESSRMIALAVLIAVAVVMTLVIVKVVGGFQGLPWCAPAKPAG